MEKKKVGIARIIKPKSQVDEKYFKSEARDQVALSNLNDKALIGLLSGDMDSTEIRLRRGY